MAPKVPFSFFTYGNNADHFLVYINAFWVGGRGGYPLSGKKGELFLKFVDFFIGIDIPQKFILHTPVIA